MNHSEIEAGQIVQLYVMGKLSAAEEERFEAHYLDCSDCLAELEASESLQRGLKGLVARQAVERTVVQAGLVAAAARLMRSRPFWLGAALVAVLLVTVVGSWRQVRRLEVALEQARSAPREEPKEANPEWRTTLAELREQLEAGNREHSEELAEATAQREQLEELLRRSRLPQAGVLIAYLSPVRSVGGPAADATRIHLQGAISEFVVALDLAAVPGTAYRVTLWRDGRSTPVWRKDSLAAGSDGELTLRFSAAFLASGDYQLEARPSATGGEPAAPTRFAFRLIGADR